MKELQKTKKNGDRKQKTARTVNVASVDEPLLIPTDEKYLILPLEPVNENMK